MHGITLSAPNTEAGCHQLTPLLETPGHPQASLRQSPVGSLLLSPGSCFTSFCCALQETISQSCVSSGSSMVGLMVTSSKRAYAIPKPAVPRAPVPDADHHWPIPPQVWWCSNTVLSQSLECKSRKSGNTWSNRQIWPWGTEWSRVKANRVFPREHTGHSKHPLPTTQEKILHMDITRWPKQKSDWLYSLQPKVEKLYTVSKNKTRSWLCLRSQTPYCQIQT